MKKTRSNPNNPTGSSVLQVLLDCQAQGGWPADALREMLAAAADKELLKETDKIFEDHRYPDSAIIFAKSRRDNELFRILTPVEMSIISIFEHYVNQSNLLKISGPTLEKALQLNDRTVRNGLAGLLEKGCIAALPGTAKNKAKIYMLNPEIATVGNPTAFVNERYFWQLTESVYEIGKNNRLTLKTPSAPHCRWIELTTTRMFVAGTESIGSVKEGNFQKYGILTLVDKKDKKTAPSSGNDEAALGKTE